MTALSADTVSIASNFTGAKIVVFGQVELPSGVSAPDAGYDLAVVLKGPPENVTTRRKGRFLGVLWVNREAETFYGVPSFYVMSSTDPASELGARPMLEENSIGASYVNLPMRPDSEMPLAERANFRQAFLRLRREHGIYVDQPGKVEFLTPTMFHTTISLPATTPVGIYTVDTFLLKDGEMLAHDQKGLTVAKTGFEQMTFDLAHEQPTLYGLAAIMLAVFTGWLAGVVFRRD
ncbi:TIGR02186 family protein [Pannonibacter phragmitetus]|uniref:TIGR02186 family protein n=1 Tax=Pannonibacter phragmitetus TaxID=121719 RepID=UPI003D2EFFB1